MYNNNMKTTNKSYTFVWEDEDNSLSFLLVLPDYNLKMLQHVDIDENSVEVTVKGAKEDVDRFIEDLEDYDFDVLDCMSRSLEFDEDYEGWLNNEVQHMLDLMKAEVELA